jgi:hypothetical protein
MVQGGGDGEVAGRRKVSLVHKFPVPFESGKDLGNILILGCAYCTDRGIAAEI